MSQQEFAQPRKRAEVQTDDVEFTQPQGENFDVDSLLDDIDSILESNATSFVQGFVQKGGQ
ncbi:ubiquitin-like protein Pup [Arcanobacterium pluranimalium]|uniref:ubiquitin-like protein Pup n=1 Tax=Arcanobacterium pluranimalium TaxID=108028 RepID=UPI001958E9CA|nr:ubiquitin-like protein Pup [Arcanobacterium pluranimalium]MBM7825373.1 ubiquitin-like protein Pup [Arcanobacterium pluranimalium]